MKINTLNDFAELINYLADNNQAKTHKEIDTQGLSKFKDSIYEVTQYLDNSNLSVSNLTPQKKDLFDALSKFPSEDRDSLSKAMLTSYYTPSYIVEGMKNQILDYWKKNNLETVNILEPSAGSGKFLNFPNSAFKNSTINAVELDNISSQILKNNFSSPNVHIHNTGFENYISEKQSDLIIGNVPFGNYNIYDNTLSNEELNIVSKKIHNYFFLKSVKELKPGGILMLMTTASMNNDKDSQSLREYLVKNTNLISCIRFSDQTFSESKTKVVSDLLILQRPLSPKLSLSQREQDYVDIIDLDIEGSVFKINKLIHENQENILGKLYVTAGFLGRPSLSVQDNASLNIEENLNNLLKIDFDQYTEKLLLDIELPNKIKPLINDKDEKMHNEILKKYPLAVPGNIVYLNNTFHQLIPSETNISFLDLKPASIFLKDQDKALLLIEVRDTYKNLREALRNNDSVKGEIFQKSLNEQYDLFSFIADSISSPINKNLLAADSERDVLRGLEIFENGLYKKADIFDLKITTEIKKTLKSNSVEDSIALSFHKYGRLNEAFISEVYEKDFNIWATEALEKGLLFINPIIKNVDTIEGYELTIPSKFNSGYIEGKLAIYKNESLLLNNNKLSSFFNRDIIEKAKDTLIDNTPIRLTIAEINPGMGEPWVDNSVYEMFAREHFNVDSFSIKHIQALDVFKISGKYSTYANTNYSVETNHNRVGYSKIFEYAMIHNIPDYKITLKTGSDSLKIADKDTTNAVLLSVDKLNKSFSQWLLSKKELSESLENKYHLLNNGIVKENFNISLFNFSEISQFDPYQHQKNAVWQNVNQLGGIIDHEVGFGKTLTMAMSTMKKKQFGLIKKELVSGLNANYVAIYESYKGAYPKGKFLLVNPEDLTPDKKQETFYKIANNEWDAVITAHSCLMKFPIAPYAQQQLQKELINEIKATLNSSDSLLSRGETNRLNKKLENAETAFKYAVDVINNKKEKGTLIFDDLGFDSATIDESHEFKNLSFSTKHSRVAGLGSQNDVQKTNNLLSYVRHIQEKHEGDKGVTFASGTTISNSITELYLLFKYLRPTMLAEKGMNSFDQWARVFARKTTEYEENVSGQIKQKERFRFFVKVPELAKMYNDITSYADFNTFKIERPLAKTNLIAIEPFKEQLDYFQAIKKFGETKNVDFLYGKAAVKSADTDIKKAVGLICTNLGRKAALSLKLIDPDFPDHPSDKINTMVKSVTTYREEYNTDKGTQLIFCDQGVPGSVNYNLYAYIKDLLIQKGVPEKEIAFIHDWDKKRDELFKKVNSGEIRILIGSTQKMGVGVNCQQKIVALHHLDFPYRPTDMVQRNGRAERPGNLVLPKHDNILNVNYYATKQSLDSYIFNLLQIKHNFILQIKNASITSRTIDEGLIDGNGAMNFAEYMAACSSNQYLTKRLQVEKKLHSLLDNQAANDLNSRQKTNKLAYAVSDIDKYEKQIVKFKNDKLHSEGIKHNVINDKQFSDEKKVASCLRGEFISRLASKNYSSPFADLGNGFGLIITAKHKDFPIDQDNYSILLKTPNNFKIGFKSNTFTKEDNEVASYSKNCIERLDFLIESTESKVKDLKINEKELLEVLSNKVDHSTEIKAFRSEIKKYDALIELENKKNSLDDDNQLNKGNNNKPSI